MNELEDEIVLSDIEIIKEQLAGMHDILEALLSCIDKEDYSKEE
jgi:hypothetical protein|tara:strand:- start:202 stop:333 length:132 start_codon:yes stop_codon:yes gene_type:complete